MKLVNLPTLFIITGESNSGGIANSEDLPIEQRGVRPSVKIINNSTFQYENLNIGVNNLLGHSGLEAFATYGFGFEVELANRAAINPFYLNQTAYLVKTGQGGSKIAEWGLGDADMNIFIQRITAAKSLMPTPNYKMVILYSQGINDAINATNVTTWKNATIAHFQDMRNLLGSNDIPIIMTEFQGMGGSGGHLYDSYSNAIAEIAATVPHVYSVNTTGAGLNGDQNHWNAPGMILVSGKMLDIVQGL